MLRFAAQLLFADHRQHRPQALVVGAGIPMLLDAGADGCLVAPRNRPAATTRCSPGLDAFGERGPVCRTHRVHRVPHAKLSELHARPLGWRPRRDRQATVHREDIPPSIIPPSGGRSASKIGSSTSIAAVMQTRSRTVEMPSGLSLPLAFGMNTRLIGSGRYVSSLSASASSASHRSTPYASMSAKSWPSIPGAPLLERHWA